MRAFLHVFLGLLMPISLISAILFTLFFTYEYSFTQAMSLGVLYGIFAGAVVTIIISIILQLLRGGSKNIQNKLKTVQKEKDTQEQEELHQIELSIDQDNSKNLKKDMNHKLMLLMNKELIFELILTMIKKQIKRSITTYDINKGSIKIKIHGENISITITPLTKHTSQIVINGIKNSKYIQNIISFLKEKEHSFLQY